MEGYIGSGFIFLDFLLMARQFVSLLEVAGDSLRRKLMATIILGILCFSQIREVQIRFQIFSL